jgi:alkylation response protein AidB-like acyl-CoA dehydrogenase
MAPLVREAARTAELARQPSDEVIEAARQGGLFEMMSPACYGGSELDLDTFFEVGVALGEADASHAWVIEFYVEHVWMFCQFPEAFQKALFADRSFVLAPAMLSPSGRATAVPGGYRLDGRWQWATGIVHGEWVIAGAMVAGERGPRPMFFALPREEVTVEDTWHMDGMCGTGSHDVVISDRLVPEDRGVDIGEMMGARAPGSKLHAGPLYSTPMAPILSFAASLPVLGQARAAVAEYASQLTDRYDMISLNAQSERTSRQSRLAVADLDVAAAEGLMRRVLAEVMDQRATADTATRVRWTASVAHAVAMCQRAVGTLCEAAGSSSHFLANPLQRIRRDVNTMACHMVFDTDERNRCHGRALLGMPSESVWH